MDKDNQPVKGSPHAAKRLARLVAVQALYQASYEQEDISVIIKSSLAEASRYLNSEEGDEPPITQKPDAELVSTIARGVLANAQSIEEMAAGSVSGKASAGRMEKILKTIISAGIFELHHCPEVPEKVIISDYVDVTKAFFNGKEPGLVNAVLDKLAKTLRA